MLIIPPNRIVFVRFERHILRRQASVAVILFRLTRLRC